MTKAINVFSMFDGMSCGQIALEKAGIKVGTYHASEIDKYASAITTKNYPSTFQMGDVTKLEDWRLEYIRDEIGIDLVIGGSPCQGFSFAGNQLNFDDPRSKLFFDFVRVLKILKPKYFLLENVRMKQESQDIISEYMGVEPVAINSNLVSAQNRYRLYWTNIPFDMPQDKGIILADILEDGVTDREKSHCLDANYFKGGNLKSYFEKHRRQLVFNNKCIQVGEATDIKGFDIIKRVYSPEGKAPTLTTMGGGHREPKVMVKSMTEVRTPEANQIRYKHKKETGKDWSPRSMRHLVERDDDKSNTITANMSKQHIIKLTKDSSQDFYYRKLTPLECERLQTVPDGYTEGVSNTQRYKMLGNGWTVDVIAHIFKGITV